MVTIAVLNINIIRFGRSDGWLGRGHGMCEARKTEREGTMAETVRGSGKVRASAQDGRRNQGEMQAQRGCGTVMEGAKFCPCRMVAKFPGRISLSQRTAVAGGREQVPGGLCRWRQC